MFFFKRRKKEKTLENKFDELNEGILNEKDSCLLYTSDAADE